MKNKKKRLKNSEIKNKQRSSFIARKRKKIIWLKYMDWLMYSLYKN